MYILKSGGHQVAIYLYFLTINDWNFILMVLIKNVLKKWLKSWLWLSKQSAVEYPLISKCIVDFFYFSAKKTDF